MTFELYKPEYNSLLDKEMLSNYDQMTEGLIKELVKVHENMLKKVLRMKLNREPTIEDAKLCTLVTHTKDRDRSEFIYNGESLGWIVRSWEPSASCVKFIPNH